MQRKPTFLLLIAFLIIGSSVAFATSQPRYVMDARKVLPAEVAGTRAELMNPSATGMRATGQTVHVGPAALPGTILGETYYDWQHNGSTGRQVDEQGGRIQATWMKSPEASISNRDIFWNKASVTGSPAPFVLDNGNSIGLLPLGNLGPVGGQQAVPGSIRAGYTNFRNRPNGGGVVYFHDAPESGPGDAHIAGIDAGVGVGVFIKNVAPQPADQPHTDDGVIWPKGTVGICGSDTILHHVGTWSGAERETWYWRGVLSGTAVTWTAPILIDTAGFISGIVEAKGDSVVVAYTKPYSSAANDDVVYRLSEDCGLTFGSVVNVSNYNDFSEEYAYLDLDLLIDPDGEIHIVWNTLFHDTTDGSTLVLPTNLNHWNSERGTVRLVTSGGWSNTGTSGCSQGVQNGLGSNTVMFSKMNLSVKPAGFGPGAGIADELLYCIWVQGGPVDTGLIGDCATQDSAGTAGGYVNMEIYWSVSSDDGFTWDRPQNVTGTKTPNCLPGDCHSENWVSAAREADSGVYISYTDDTHPAGAVNAVQRGEWALATYRVQALEARLPVIAPVIGVGPQLNYVELNVAPGGSKSLNVAINNLGNATLNFDVVVTGDDGGATHVLVNGGGSYSGSVAAGGASEILSIQYDGIGLPNPSEYDWRLEVTSNDETNDPGQGGTPIDIKLNVFVADPWYTCTSDTISTGLHRLAVGSCLELGDAGDGGGLFAYADSSEWVFDASPVIARLDGPTKRAYRDIFWNSTADRSRDSNRAYRAQSVITVNRNTTVGGKAADQASGVATTTDSLIQIDWTVTAFREPELTNGAVAQYLVTNRTGTTFNGLILGAAADLDVDSLSASNNGITDETVQYIGAQGGYLDTSGTIFTPQSNFAALFNIPLDAGCTDAALGGQVLDNVDYIYPENAYNTDTLYNVLERMLGWNASTLQADTITDVNVTLSISKNNTLTPAGSLQFAIGLAISDVSESDLKATIALLKNAVNDSCIAGCPITLTGDVNLSGTITSADIIGLVNFVFKGGLPPQPCAAAGDVNCSGTVTSADIIGLVNFVFKGGAPPCDACGSALAGDC